MGWRSPRPPQAEMAAQKVIRRLDSVYRLPGDRIGLPPRCTARQENPVRRLQAVCRCGNEFPEIGGICRCCDHGHSCSRVALPAVRDRSRRRLPPGEPPGLCLCFVLIQNNAELATRPPPRCCRATAAAAAAACHRRTTFAAPHSLAAAAAVALCSTPMPRCGGAMQLEHTLRPS